MSTMTMSRRRLLLSLAGTAALCGRFGSARAEVDLLKTPARMSALAPHVMLLGIAIAGERLVAVGERGVIVWSEDAGTTWRQAQVPVSVTLTAVAFADARKGWAVGHDGAVLHSADGGQQWTLQFDGNGANAAVLATRKAAVQAARSTEERQRAESALADVEESAEFGPSRPLLDVCMADAMRGWVVGAFGQVFGTTDGGHTWVYAGDALPNPDGLHCNRISRLPDRSLVIAAEAGKVFRTRDEGRSWQVHDTGYAGHLYGVLPGGTAGVLIAYGFAGHILRSEDDGLSWRELPALTSTSLIGGMRLASGRLLLVDRGRRILASDDAGKTWRLLSSEPGRALGGIAPSLVKDRLPVVGTGGMAWLSLKGRES
ncbi:MAG TPA: YCF48-related protein [Burkholderiaceae bacterium]|nr:YCF48-related protein [Burkholderiaceae bacterium]